MMHRGLFNLFKANAKRGSFKAEANVIYLYDVIVGSDADAEWFGGVSPQAFATTLAGMSGTVHLRINSPGGDVFAARAMAQAMREYDGEIIAHVDGYAASSASLIAASGSKCIMAPGSFIMIHKAWTWGVGNSDDLLATAALLEKVDGTIAQTYASKAGGEPNSFAAMMAKETWFTAEEAIEIGLADEVAAEEATAASARATWDVSAYAAAPKTNVETPDPAIAAAAAAVAETAEAERLANETEHRKRVHAARMLLTAA
jgi:ATP-dependent protease ClpP protease subunit